MTGFSEYVPNVHFEQIPIKNLVSNQKYQRNLSALHIQRTVKNFDLYQVNPVKVSRRNGINYVFNGQHTIETIAIVSGSRETPVWCMIYDDLDYTTEADIFANQQKYVRALRPHEVFFANVEAGNDTQLIIKDLVESYGLTIGRSHTLGSICAVSTLEFIYQNYGFHVLSRTLRLCIGAWEGEILSLSANMLRGVARLIAAYGDEMKDDIFREKVGQISPKEIGRTAKGLTEGALGYAEVMLEAYNRKMKSSLPWTKLHAQLSVAQTKNEHSLTSEKESETANDGIGTKNPVG